MVKFTIGADPEFFLQDNEGKLISAVGLIGGTKQHPLPITDQGHCVQEDNVSVEFNVPPSDSASLFVNHLNLVLDHLKGKAAALNLQFAEGVASASFPKDQLMTLESQVFGCEPDYNAWTLLPNPRPISKDDTLRSCGGHVHVGTDLDPIFVVRAMDYFLGIPSVILDGDTRRRELYGKAGACRLKPYGVEYRTLSNFWLWKDEFKRWVYKQTAHALDFVASGQQISMDFGEQIQHIINTGNVHEAKRMGTLDSRIAV